MPVISIPWSPLHTLLFLLYCPYVQTQDISYKACISVFNMPNPNRCYISSISIFSKTPLSSSIALYVCEERRGCFIVIDLHLRAIHRRCFCTIGISKCICEENIFRTDGQMAHLIVSTFFSHGLSAKCQIPNSKYTGSVPKTEVKAGPARTDDKFRHNSKTRDCYPLHNSKRISLDERKSWKFFS